MEVDRMTLAYARLALNKAVRNFLFAPNINLVDFGHPEHEGEIDYNDLAIRIHVQRKLSGVTLETALESGRTVEIPPSIDGFPTDVPEGVYRPNLWYWYRRSQPPTDPRAVRSDPLRGGISISNEYHNNYGTLGGKVIDRITGREMMLSNWHVLVGDWLARPNRRIYQPGRLDNGGVNDEVATLTRDAMAMNVDAAVATLNGRRRFLNDQIELGPVRGVGQAKLGTEVVKSGRRTGVTHGRVSAINGIAKLTYTGLDRIIRNVVTIEPHTSTDEVSGGGDSGSWWLDAATMQAVGLHFAGSSQPERGLAIDMQTVLDALAVDLVTEV